MELKKMQINNCTREQRIAICELAKLINPRWNRHIDDYGDYCMTHKHLIFDGTEFAGSNHEKNTENIISFDEFIAEMKHAGDIGGYDDRLKLLL